MGIYIKKVGVPLNNSVHYFRLTDAGVYNIVTMCSPTPQPAKGVKWNAARMYYMGSGLRFTRNIPSVTCDKCLRKLVKEELKSK